MNSNYGTIRIKLTELTQYRNMSKNAVMKKNSYATYSTKSLLL